MEILKRDRVFSTPWFNIIAKTLNSGNPNEPYYALELHDYAVIVPLTPNQELVLVRQYRPAVETYTLELPSGHVEPGEDPQNTARRELREETGYDAGELEFLGDFVPDTGRFSNKMWCYFAPNVTPNALGARPEENIEVILCPPQDFLNLVRQNQFNHALHLAPILLALLGEKLLPLEQIRMREENVNES
ncbi:NUDIX hydrolase [Lusitaniella coriacea LEGE 07157]|uniref:NUDIX hydrolase n=1 Tax=Lusitaniella coriacea LEGE 07157 TaxID=945747 RepID=A0A8J7AW61_9CYAN|nr:NUDIX hydrolase [Lusitaniella coriacea]MBE9114447.1 NUDIX hydrolase [Lusitaniella coriacea LEGE 07157]